MKKAGKLAAFLLAAAFMMTACHSAADPEAPASPNSSSGSPASSQVEIDPEAKYDEPVTVNIAYATNAASTEADWDGNTSSDNPWTRYLLDHYNIKINILWEAVDANGQYQTKLDLAIATNDLPDIIRTKNYSQFLKLNQGGRIADLTDYYASCMSDLSMQYATADGGQTQSYGVVDDRRMGITASDIKYINARLVFIREDWFNELGCEEPKTMEDIINISKQFVDSGKAQFALPLFKSLCSDNMCDIVGMANAYGAFPRIWVDDGTGKAVYGSVQPEMKAVLQSYADLYKGGYIDPAFASLDGTKVAEQLTSDKIGVILGACWLPTWPLNSNFELNGTNWKCYPILPSSTLDGALKVQADAPTGSMLCVRKDFEHPEALFKILNTVTEKLADPDTQSEFHSYVAGDKTIQVFGMNPLGFYFEDPMTNFNTYKVCNEVLQGGDESKLITAGQKIQYPKLKAYQDALSAGNKPEVPDWVIAQLFYGPTCAYANLNSYFENGNYIVDLLPGYQTDEMARQWGNLMMLEDQYFTEIISGSKTVDAGFQEFVDAWSSMSGEKITQEVNDWFSGNAS